jgi:3-hydroxyisobutyrate dehydrogenase-like beta-hydroxyacid dehydrogenase
MKIAILGTGRMGSAIAQRLRERGHRLLLWNRTRSKAEQLGLGEVAESAFEAAHASDLVLSSLTDPIALREVYLAPNGALQGAHGQTFVDMSTVGIEVIGEINVSLQKRGSELLSCPIAGTPVAVAQGNSVLLLGGNHERADAIGPVLQQIGEVRYVGTARAAALLKLASNCVVATQNVLAAELLAAAKASGLDPVILFEHLERLAPGLVVRRKHYLRSEPQPVVFTIAYMLKDLQLAMDTLDPEGQSLPLTRWVRDLVSDAARAHPERDLAYLRD